MGSSSTNLERVITAPPSWGTRLVGLEGLRGIAAFSVVAVHVAAETAEASFESGGPFWSIVGQFRHGLTLFFVLSGFLLFRPFASAVLANKNRPPLGRFWFNRVVRIFPAYIAIVLITSYLLQTARLSTAEPTDAASSSGTLSALDLAWSITMLQTFNPDQLRTGLGVAWSLTVELTFYLLLPLLGLLGAWVARKTRNVLIGAVAPVLLLFNAPADNFGASEEVPEPSG